MIEVILIRVQQGQIAIRDVELFSCFAQGLVRYQPITTDRFGRNVAVVCAGTVNLSCWQLQQRQAIYKPYRDRRPSCRACR